jgi:uncharacterized protein YdeI (YjbR/CyaY-like superfamily)
MSQKKFDYEFYPISLTIPTYFTNIFSKLRCLNLKTMLKKGEHIEGVPSELQALLNQDEQANTFFESLSKSYKQAYCDWVGAAKQEATRKTRADKALLMLRNNQKTLKTV